MAVLPYEMRWPLRQNLEVLRKGLPALRTLPVTPLTLTVPHDRVVTWVDTCAASAWPLAPAPEPGKNMASEARAATERRPAGNRNWVRIVLVSGARTPRMPT